MTKPGRSDIAQMARLAARVETSVTLADPVHRFYGWLGLVTVAAGACYISVQLPLRYGLPLAAATAVLVALAFCGAIYVGTRIGAAREFASAIRLWSSTTSNGARSVAALVDVHGHPTLRYVASEPRGAHAGTQLLDRICADADNDHIDISLRAVNAYATNFYRRHGFVVDADASSALLNRFRGTPMTRPANAVTTP